MNQPTPQEFIRWQESTGLADWQVGLLAHASVLPGVGRAGVAAGKGRRTTQCSTVQRWKNGSRVIPLATWELLQAKVSLLRRKLATFEELTTVPLATLIDSDLKGK